MTKGNCAIIKKEKTKEFESLLRNKAKDKAYWKKNKEYIKKHRINSNELEALYRNE